jgi:hypothetical protein
MASNESCTERAVHPVDRAMHVLDLCLSPKPRVLPSASGAGMLGCVNSDCSAAIVAGATFQSGRHLCGSPKPCVCCWMQVLACLVAAIVAGMTLQSGSAIHQQIKRSVYIDTAVHDSTADAGDIAGAARKLHGMLYTGLVSCYCCCSQTLTASNAPWCCHVRIADRQLNESTYHAAHQSLDVS